MANRRSSAQRISIFNHKGGVGKTTLTANVADALVSLDYRVLLVDADPQCNLTSYMVDAEVVDDLLDHSDSPKGATLWSAVKPVVDGTGDVRHINPIELPSGCLLLPGDIRLSDFESELTDFWSQSLQRKARGFKGTSAISSLVDRICKEYEVDFVFYDCGPNIGALNRSVLLDCDYFIVAAACDQFSVRALKTLGRTLAGWIEEWQTIAGLAPEQTYLLPGHPVFIGYIPQQFRIYGGAITRRDARFLVDLQRRSQSEIAAVLRKIDRSLALPPNSDFKIGEVRDLHAMVNESQRQSLPMRRLKRVGSQSRLTAKKIFISLANAILARIDKLKSST
jgi:cellulose biosynthesis protein BcsQ